MSDLEATSSRTHAAAPITAIATGKLRAISGNQPLFSQTEGLVDAFAEVFARMAQSSAKPVESAAPAAETEDEPVVADQANSDDREHGPSESDAQPARTETVIEIARPDQEFKQADHVGESVLDDDPVLLDKPTEVAQGNVAPIAEQIVVANVETEEAYTSEAEIEGAEVIAPKVVETDGNEHSRRDRRKSTSNLPNETLSGDLQNQHRTLPTEPTEGTNDKTGVEQEQGANPVGEHDQVDSRRRLRGRPRYTRETGNDAAIPVSQSNPTRSQQRHQPVATPTSISDLTGATSGRDQPVATSPLAKSLESNIAQVQAAAASAGSSTASARPQPGVRATTQAIESTMPAHNATRTKPKSRPTDGGAKETVSRIKLIQRVSKAFQHLGPEGGVVRLRLAPAEMGSVRVEMRIHQRKVQARVVAEVEAASAALREHLPDLRARLESFGMQVDRIDIETDSTDLHQGSHFQAESQNHGHTREQRDYNHPLHQQDRNEDEPVSSPVSQGSIANPAHAVSAGMDVRL